MKQIIAGVIALVSCTLVARAAEPAAIGAFAEAWAAVPGYTATIDSFEKEGSKTQNSVFTYAFTKPEHVTMKVVKGPSAGATVVWNGGKTVTASKSGMLGISMSKTVPLNDPLVTSLRGGTVKDLSFGSILAHAEHTPGTRTQGSASLNGAIADTVTLVPSDPAKDRGLTREVLYLSRSTHLPLRVDGFTGNELMSSIQFTATQRQ